MHDDGAWKSTSSRAARWTRRQELEEERAGCSALAAIIARKASSKSGTAAMPVRVLEKSGIVRPTRAFAAEMSMLLNTPFKSMSASAFARGDHGAAAL